MIGAAKVQRAVAGIDRPVHQNRAALLHNVPIRIDSIAGRIDHDRTARKANLIAGVCLEAVAGIRVIVTAARGIDAVIACGDMYGSAANGNAGALEALVALLNLDGSVLNDERVVGVHAVIPGRNIQISAGHNHRAVGMHCVVRRIDPEGAAAEVYLTAAL